MPDNEEKKKCQDQKDYYDLTIAHYEEATEDAEKAYNDLHNANVYRDKVEQLWWNNQFDNCMGECELPPYEEKYAIVGTRIVRVESERSKKHADCISGCIIQTLIADEALLAETPYSDEARDDARLAVDIAQEEYLRLDQFRQENEKDMDDALGEWFHCLMFSE